MGVRSSRGSSSVQDLISNSPTRAEKNRETLTYQGYTAGGIGGGAEFAANKIVSKSSAEIKVLGKVFSKVSVVASAITTVATAADAVDSYVREDIKEDNKNAARAVVGVVSTVLGVATGPVGTVIGPLVDIGGNMAIDALMDPLIIDLDGDGIELVGLDGSTILFDMHSSGNLSQTGWVGADVINVVRQTANVAKDASQGKVEDAVAGGEGAAVVEW